MKRVLTNRMLIFAAIMAFATMIAAARDFEVESFRTLTNDVTSFVNPVRDLNGDACALIKVPASPDFVFSTPLGIVRREDKVGEIWLYVPRGTVRLTIKHPQWGVLRDYKFPGKLESHVAYELRLSVPDSLRDRAYAEPVVTIVRDTLVVTHTDTIVATPEKPRVPLTVDVMACEAFGGPAKSFMSGLMVAVMTSHGGYARLLTNFGKTGHTSGSCDKSGYIGDNLPYYTGRTRHASLIATAGAIHRLSSVVCIFEGLGYGYDTTAWELAGTTQNNFVKNSGYSLDGISFEVGAVVNLRRLSLSASVTTIAGRQWYGAIGVGYIFGRL